MIRCAGNSSKIGQSVWGWLLKPSAARNCAVMFNQRMSVSAEEEIFGEILPTKLLSSSTASSVSRQIGTGVPYLFKSMDFVNLKNKRNVKEEIRETLNNTNEKLNEQKAVKVIKSCGGAWFDVGMEAKNNVLTRFMDAYLSKNQITSRIGNRLLLSYAENKKDFDSKLLLKSFLDAGVRPNNETYCAIIQLEVARGNFQSALDVYKFCTDQNLDLLPSAALSLLSGSVIKERPDLTTEFERVFDSLDRNFEYGRLSKSLAAAIGHAEKGAIAELESFLANAGMESSFDYKIEFLKAFCFVYKSLAERKSNDSAAQCRQFLEQMKPNISPELFLVDKILGVTCSHLYANKCVEASLELKKSIPQGVPQLWSKISDELFTSSILANDKDPVVMLVSKFRGFKESQILDRPLTTLIGQSIRDEDKISEISTMMSSFLENPEVEVKPHFYFPFFINPGESLPVVSRVKAFCECLEEESYAHFRFTAEGFERILRSQPLMIEHLLSMQSDLIRYPKYNCVLVEVLLKKQRFAEAAVICENMTELPKTLALKLISFLLDEISHGDFAVVPIAKVFGKCYHSLSENDRQQIMENLVADFNAGSISRSKLNGAVNLFSGLRDENCFMNASQFLTTHRPRDLVRIDGAYQALFHPEDFLRATVFTRNVLNLSEEKRKEMLQQLTSESFADSEIGNIPEHQKQDKIIILNASLGNFEPLESYFASRGEEGPQNGKTLMASDGRTDLLLEILLEADKTLLALEVLKNSRRFNQVSMDSHKSFFPLFKTKSQLEALQAAIFSFDEKRLAGIAGNFTNHLLALNEKDLLKSFAERCMTEMSFSYPLYIYFRDVCETESLETCKEIYDMYHQKFMHNLLRQPMVTACVRFSSSPLSKEILTDILRTNGSNKENEFSAGDVLLAYLQAGKYEKAKEFAKNRVVSMLELHVQQTVRHGDYQSTSLLAKANGNCVADDGSFTSIANFVFNEMKLEWNKATGEEMKLKQQEFCKTVTQTLIDEKYPISRNAFVKLHEVANWVGVNVPSEYSRRYIENFKFKLWLSVNDGNVSDAMKAIESARGKIVSHSKEIAALVDLIEDERPFNMNENYFLDFLTFNRTRMERGSPKYVCNKLLKDHEWHEETFQFLLRAFAVSDLNQIHRSLLMGTSRLSNPAAPFSYTLPFYLTYNSDNFASYAVRNFVQTRSVRNGILVLYRLHRMDPSVVDASAEALSSAISLVETELLKYLSNDEIESQLRLLGGHASNSEGSINGDMVQDDQSFESEAEQVSQ